MKSNEWRQYWAGCWALYKREVPMVVFSATGAGLGSFRVDPSRFWVMPLITGGATAALLALMVMAAQAIFMRRS
jgi:hypothetical protein